ncbi:MAG: hypothetical protein P1U68_01100 [Verrucomicrobiales bacterium]|nr:hypothetical protein [Verrucomicrobiales bacterium]
MPSPRLKIHRRGGIPAALFSILFFTSQLATGHPLPEIPVWAFFEKDGSARFEIEVDPRCFVENPEDELYMLHWYLQRCDKEEKNEMFEQAKAFIPTRVDLVFGPDNWKIDPDYHCEFTTRGGKPLRKLDDPVMIRVSFETRIPRSVKTYQLHAHDVGIFSVLFLNHFNDAAVPRIQTLFPGEKSYALSLEQPPEK